MMPKILSHKYPLIPSIQFRTQLSPLALLPALPVRLGSNNLQLYAAIDTGAKISSISGSMLQELSERDLEVKKQRIETIDGLAEIAEIHLIVCDPAFTEWVDLGKVPFAISRKADSISGVRLGYDSCLAKLRVDIDYPRQIFKVYAPTLAKERSESGATGSSARIKESETLIAIGSYEAAVAMTAAALEEALGPPVEMGFGKSWNLVARANQARNLGPEAISQLKTIWNLRNIAIHGSRESKISKKDAQAVLRTAKDLISALSAQRTETEGVKKSMANVYVEARPKGRPEGSAILDYVVEDHANHELGTFKTQKEAIDWAKANGHAPLVARVRHLNDKKTPDHWRSA